MDLTTERQLIERAKTDPEAFGEIFNAYYGRILNYIVRRTGDVAVAQDITAETFTKALRKLNSFQWRGVSIEAWLFTIATNELRMYFRGQRRLDSLDELQERDGFEPQSELNLEEELQEAQEKLERKQAFRAAQQLLLTLPQHYQETLVLRFMEGKKVAEIAVILKKPEGTVKSLLSRGLTLLRDKLAVQPKHASRIVESEGK